MRRVEWTARGLMKVLKHPSFLFPVEHLGILSTCYSFYPLPHQLYQPADLITTSQCNWIVIFVDYIYRLSGGGKKGRCANLSALFLDQRNFMHEPRKLKWHRLATLVNLYPLPQRIKDLLGRAAKNITKTLLTGVHAFFSFPTPHTYRHINMHIHKLRHTQATNTLITSPFTKMFFCFLCLKFSLERCMSLVLWVRRPRQEG